MREGGEGGRAGERERELGRAGEREGGRAGERESGEGGGGVSQFSAAGREGGRRRETRER